MPVLISEGAKVVLIGLFALLNLSTGVMLLNDQVDVEIVYISGGTYKGLIHTTDDNILFAAEEKENGNIKFKFYNKNGQIEIDYERDNNGSIPEEDKKYIDKILDEVKQERELRKKEQELKEKEQDTKQLQFEKKQELDKYKFDKKGEFQKEKEGMNKKTFWDYIRNLKGGIF